MASLKALSRDRGTSIFLRPKDRSLNTPDVKLAHQSVTNWLNGIWDTAHDLAVEYRNTPESRERILNLLSAVKSEVAGFEEEMLPIYRLPAVSQQRYFETKQAHFPRITALMADYATVPLLAYHPKTRRWGLGIQAANPTHRPYGEVMAAHSILELIRKEALGRLKLCDCGAWYFAPQSRSPACNATCRKRLFDNKPEQRLKRQIQAKANAKVRSGKIYLETTE